MPGAAPVSDRSLYLWLSAVLGVWYGISDTLSDALPFAFQLKRPTWAIASAAMTVVISVIVISAAPRPRSRWRRLGDALLSLAVTLLSARLAWELAIRFEGSDLFQRPYDFVRDLYWFSTLRYGQRLLLLRLACSWGLVCIGAIVFRSLRHYLPKRPAEPCHNCAFDQSGLPPHDICPECGRPWKHRMGDQPTRYGYLARRLCRMTCVLLLVGILISAIPETVISQRYAALDPIAVAYHRDWGTGYLGGASSIVFLVWSEERHTGFLTVTHDSSFDRNTSVSRLSSQFYLDNPLENYRLQSGKAIPTVAQDGLMPLAKIMEAFINTPPPP